MTESRAPSWTTLLAWILAAGLMARLVMALSWSLPLGGDAIDYHRLGQTIASGQGMVDGLGRPSSFRPPAYPAFVGLVYAVVGAQPLAVRLLQALLGTTTVLLVFLLGRRAFGVRVGLAAAALVAVDLGQISTAGRLLSEGVFTLVLVGMVLMSLSVAEKLRNGEDAWMAAAGAGALAGLGALTRGILLPYPIFMVFGMMWSGRAHRARAARATCALLLAWVLVISPWTARNARVHGAFVPVTTQVGITFYSGQNPPEGRLFGILSTDSVVRSVAHLAEAERSDALLGAGLESLRNDPARLPLLESMKLLFFVVPFDWEVLPWYGVLNPGYAFIAIWCLVALFLTLGPGRRKGMLDTWPLWLPIVFFLLMALVFYGSPRLRLPVEPLMAVGAAWALVQVASLKGPRRAVTLALACYIPLLGLFLAGEHAKDVARVIMTALGLWS